jgi:hypothetical protein
LGVVGRHGGNLALVGDSVGEHVSVQPILRYVLLSSSTGSKISALIAKGAGTFHLCSERISLNIHWRHLTARSLPSSSEASSGVSNTPAFAGRAGTVLQ